MVWFKVLLFKVLLFKVLFWTIPELQMMVDSDGSVKPKMSTRTGIWSWCLLSASLVLKASQWRTGLVPALQGLWSGPGGPGPLTDQRSVMTDQRSVRVSEQTDRWTDRQVPVALGYSLVFQQKLLNVLQKQKNRKTWGQLRYSSVFLFYIEKIQRKLNRTIKTWETKKINYKV